MKEVAWGARPRTVSPAVLLGDRLNSRRPAPICMGRSTPGAGIGRSRSRWPASGLRDCPPSLRPPVSSSGLQAECERVMGEGLGWRGEVALPPPWVHPGAVLCYPHVPRCAWPWLAPRKARLSTNQWRCTLGASGTATLGPGRVATGRVFQLCGVVCERVRVSQVTKGGSQHWRGGTQLARGSSQQSRRRRKPSRPDPLGPRVGNRHALIAGSD